MAQRHDFITVDQSGGAVTVSGLAETVTISHAEGAPDQLTIAGGIGDDVIDASRPSGQPINPANGGAGNDVILGSHGNDIVNGGTGNDVAALGDGNDLFTWNPGDGSDFVDGQGGFDTLAFNGSNIGETANIAATGSQVTLTRDVANITMHLTNMERIDFAAGAAPTISRSMTSRYRRHRLRSIWRRSEHHGRRRGSRIASPPMPLPATTISTSRLSRQRDHGQRLVGASDDRSRRGRDHLTVNAGTGNDTINASAISAGATAHAKRRRRQRRHHRQRR